MTLFIEPCLPTISRMVPTGPQWAYEFKHDGFRFLAVRQGKRVRAFTRGGHDWSKQLPAIADAMQALPVRSAVLDGEGVICGPDGKSDFDAMRAVFGLYGTRAAFLYAFDLLELDVAICATRYGLAAVPPWCSSSTTPIAASGCVSISRTSMAPWCLGRPASWGWRASSPSDVTFATGRDGPAIGSRSKTRRIRRSSGPC